MNVVIFDTEKAAIQSQQHDYETFIAQHNDAGYLESTNRWAEIKQREDGKWYYPVCPACDYRNRVVVAHVEDPSGDAFVT